MVQKKIFLFSYFIFKLIISFSQTFEAIIPINNITKPYCVIECSNGYLISLKDQDSENDHVHGRIIKIDNTGNILGQMLLNEHYFEIIKDIQFIGDNNFMGLGLFHEKDTSNAHGLIIIFSEELIIQKEINYNTIAKYDDIITQSSVINNQNQVVSLLSVEDNNGLDLMYWNTINKKGEIIQSATIEKSNSGGLNISTSLIEDYNKTGYYNFTLPYIFHYNHDFLQIDSLHISYVSENPNDTFGPWYYAKWKDSILYIGGVNNLNEKQNCSIAKFDIQLNFIEQHQLTSENGKDYPSLYKSMDFYNENFYLSSIYDFRFGNTFSNYNNGIRITCFDRDLNVKWDKVFGDTAYYFSYYTLATKDGGCIVAGTRYDFNQPERRLDLYLLKVDSLGNYTPTDNIEKPLSQSPVSLYPNPGNNTINIKIPYSNKNVTFNLYNIAGKKVLSKQVNAAQATIKTQHLPIGMYVYELRKNGMVFNRGKWVKQ